MTTFARKTQNIQDICDKIIRINNDWANEEYWIKKTSWGKSYYIKGEYNYSCSLPDSIYFSYTENRVCKFLDTTVLSDILEAVDSMLKLKPVWYGMACDKGLDSRPLDVWCVVLDDISADMKPFPQEHVLSNPLFLGKIDAILDWIDYYWYLPFCDTSIRDALNERLELIGTSPMTTRWAWHIRDNINAICGDFVNPNVPIDGEKYNELGYLFWSTDSLSEELGFDVTKIVCCPGLKKMINQLYEREFSHTLHWSVIEVNASSHKRKYFPYYNEPYVTWTEEGGRKMEDVGDGEFKWQYIPTIRNVWNGILGGPPEWWDTGEEAGNVGIYAKHADMITRYIGHWYGTFSFDTFRVGPVEPTEKSKKSVIYVAGTSFHEDHGYEEHADGPIPEFSVPPYLSSYLNSDNEGVWREEVLYNAPFTERKDERNRKYTGLPSFVELPDHKEPTNEDSAIVFSQVSVGLDSMRIDDYTPSLTML